MKRFIAVAFLTFIISSLAFGQAARHTENSPDTASRSAGRINPSNLGMEIDIPIAQYPGRGINVPISVSYSSKVWRMDYKGDTPGPIITQGCRSLNEPTFAEGTASGWSSSLSTPYIEYVGKDNFFTEFGFPYNGSDQSLCDGQAPPQTDWAFVKRLVVHLPGGETHELRADDTPIVFDDTQNSHLQQSNWNTTFYAVDGSNIRYVENSSTPTYKLMLPDGSFYEFATTSDGNLRRRYATKYTDRNGNYITYNTNGTVTDTLGRTLSLPVPNDEPTTAQTQEITPPGMTESFKFVWKQLKGSTSTDSGLTNFNQDLKYRGEHKQHIGNGNWELRPSGTFLFSSIPSTAYAFAGGETLFNPIVLTEIELPTGQKYKFSYDIYGRIEKVTYPTGGVETFTYSLILPMTVSITDSISDATNFGVTNRKVYENPNGSYYEWTYGAAYTSSPSGYKVTTVNPDNTMTERILHRGTDPCTSGCTHGTFGFDNVLTGMPYEESAYDGSSPRKLLSRKLTTWTKKSFSTPGLAYADWHPRVTQEELRTYDNSGNGVSTTTTYAYEGDLNYRDTPVLTKTTAQYPFVTAGSSPPSNPARSTEKTFLINDSNYSAVKTNYSNQNIFGLVTVSKVKDSAGTVVSQSETVYDESGRSPGYRGNPTTVKAWDSTKGAVTNSAAYISNSAKFDSDGNQYEATDARGNTTTTAFDSTYNTFPASVTSPIPDQTGGTYGSTSAFVTQSEFYTTAGLPKWTKDANNLRTEIGYDFDTFRPRFVKTYDNNGSTPIGGITETVYNDTVGSIWVKNRTQIDGSNWAETLTHFDGLGRAYRTEEVNSDGNIFVDKEFDADGRVLRVSNPYRNGETVKWTTNVYDNASRVISVTLPDGSSVGTDYGVSTSAPIGVTKQITDQANKKRKGFTDALGNMVRVVEDPTSQNLVTDYTFDTLGNLRKTVQGDQTRFFSHDSLGRLIRAKQVEQDVNSSLNLSAADPVTGNNSWTVKYVYDDNGNITSTTDARNQSITATYDRLNRLQVRDYSDTGTPDVYFYYDGKYKDVNDTTQTATGAVKGKATGTKTSVSKTNYTAFDVFGRPIAHQQITDGTTYTTGYTYNLSGALIEQTYPSGRVVKNTIDENGDLSQVQSKKNSSSGFWTYADAFAYNSSGAITKMQLGNGRWETFKYNDRQQITQIGLGTTDTNTNPNLLKLEFGYGNSSQNNGSMLEQKITVPAVGSNSAFTAIQTYTYDSLNRIQSSTETVNSSQTWKQTFTIDRYGNRKFDAANTTTIGSCPTAVCNPNINTSDNRFSSNQGYGYDANGNVTQDATGQRFGYDAENHQKTFFNSSNPGSTPDWTYGYDGDGRRVKKESATEVTVFVYDATGKLVAEYASALAQTQEVSYLTTDHLGSPRITTNENGVVTNRKDFMAYGDEAISAQRVSGTNGNGYTPSDVRKDYTGYEKDMESGLEFAQARYYSTTQGRYTSVDPLSASASIKNPQTFNRYTYVLNSPYKFVDPLGLLSVDTIACGMCGNEDLYVDGSAFRGRDASQDWAGPVAEPPQPPASACPTPCPTSTATPPLPQGWEIKNGVLVKTNGANDLASVTVNAADDAGQAAAKKASRWSKIWRGIKFVGGKVGGIVTHIAVELAWPGQTVGEAGVSDAPSLSAEQMATFEPGTVHADKLDNDAVFFRVFGGRSQMEGDYFSTTAYGTTSEARKNLAIRPEWSDANQSVSAIAPAGTLIYRGRAKSQGRGYEGGGIQIFIPSFRSLRYGPPMPLKP